MLKIKLSRLGKKGFSFYRIVVNEARSKRDGRFVENLGSYNPNTKPATVKIDKKRLDYWLSHGAKLTESLSNILKRA